MTQAPLLILPDEWVEAYEPVPDGWFEEHAPNLLRVVPDMVKWVTEICSNVNVSWKLIPVRIELEQSAISYAWDGTTTSYGGGHAGDQEKLKYLCGADKTDSGPRPNGWFGPRPQMLAYVLRLKYWYRGINPSGNWGNWLGLREDPAFQPGVPVTRRGTTIVPANRVSADCLRYTTGMDAQFRLAALARKWFPADFRGQFGNVVVERLQGPPVTGELLKFDDHEMIAFVVSDGHRVGIPYHLIGSIRRTL